ITHAAFTTVPSKTMDTGTGSTPRSSVDRPPDTLLASMVEPYKFKQRVAIPGPSAS
ncbi:hypothetical protein NDU88_000907, partial [Pleurodeles waltl]